MKVAMLAPIAWRTPPRHYGPWELVTSLLTEGLVARGVEVTLFATLDSQTSAVLRGVSPRGYAEDASMDGRVWEALHVATALSASTDFDLLHNQMDWLPLALSDLCDAPMGRRSRIATSSPTPRSSSMALPCREMSCWG